MDFYKLLNNLVSNNQSNIEIYVIGKNDETLNLAKLIKIKGIIDDFSKEKIWKNIEIFNSNSISKKSIIINCSTSISPVDVKINLKSNGFNNVIDYFQLESVLWNFKKPYFCKDAIDDFHINSNEYENLSNKLSDEVSKKTLKDVLAFRLTANPEYMNEYTVRLNEQYMEEFMMYSNETMIDVGGFDGDTADIFTKKYSDYKKICLFEPSEKNIIKAKQRLSQIPRIEYYNIGLSDSKKVVYFDGSMGSSSKINENGIDKINLEKLDDILDEEITFIKMDIEGHELDALRGCINHIKNNHPKLAIAVYHNIQDFWKIPNYILSIREDYEIYLRHYTQGWSETIMYFKPKNLLN